VVAVHWGDDYTSAMGICIATIGAAPNRQWVVEWSQGYYCCGAGPVLTYEAILSENSGRHRLRLSDDDERPLADGRPLEDATGTMAIGACGTSTYMCLPTAGNARSLSRRPLNLAIEPFR